jgi:hypothetical protein
MATERAHSIASVLSIVGAIIGFYLAGDIVLSKQVLAMAFMAGYTLDNAVNKS